MTKSQDKVNIAVLTTKVDIVVDTVKSIDAKLERDYVTQDSFEPIKRLVYGMVGVTLTAVILGLLALIIKKQ